MQCCRIGHAISIGYKYRRSRHPAVWWWRGPARHTAGWREATVRLGRDATDVATQLGPRTSLEVLKNGLVARLAHLGKDPEGDAPSFVGAFRTTHLWGVRVRSRAPRLATATCSDQRHRAEPMLSGASAVSLVFLSHTTTWLHLSPAWLRQNRRDRPLQPGAGRCQRFDSFSGLSEVQYLATVRFFVVAC